MTMKGHPDKEGKMDVKSEKGKKGVEKKEMRKSVAPKSLTSKKAKMILKDGTVKGHKISKKQKGFFGAIAGKIKSKLKGK